MAPPRPIPLPHENPPWKQINQINQINPHTHNLNIHNEHIEIYEIRIYRDEGKNTDRASSRIDAMTVRHGTNEHSLVEGVFFASKHHERATRNSPKFNLHVTSTSTMLTDRQTDRQAGRQKERKKERKREREKERERKRATLKYRSRRSNDRLPGRFCLPPTDVSPHFSLQPASENVIIIIIIIIDAIMGIGGSGLIHWRVHFLALLSSSSSSCLWM